jgi:hypothetical protein
MRRTTLFATVLATLCLILDAAPVFAANFDGVWKVRRTGVGCKPKGVIKVQITDGTISGQYTGGSGVHLINGAINNAGAFTFNGQSPRDLVKFQGQIADKKGKGTWNIDGRKCGRKLRMYR